ncbi:GATA-type zinc finger protein 1 [Neopsephotus bourkii]|uniref:GATA-type zinc finger protein 1 n=1 Tax=Neopsephotus bourkii TaxID=309878 RepID=UPI002AA54055|nr:GATA-type zinc finger protein 1 [Neopsephotus bourkii]
MEPLFLEEQSPDFSVLQRLLCLEPGPGLEPGAGAGPDPDPDPGPAVEAAAHGVPGDITGGILERPPAPCSPGGGGLRFLQETVRLLPPPAPPMAPPAPPLPSGLPEQRGAAPVPPPRSSGDALSLISLQCQRLSGPRRRKQAEPKRGAGPGDPRFRGVTLRMRLDLRSCSADGCGLLISARGCRAPKRSSPEAGEGGSERIGPVGPGSKRCASCGTRRTLLWRAAEDGTPLCNACGIRYRRYRVRCQRCWNIPGKSRIPHSRCPRCGERCPQAGK